MDRPLIQAPDWPARSRWFLSGALVLCSLFAAAPSRAQGTLTGIESDVDRIAKRVRPAVVTVIAQLTERTGPRASGTRIHSRVGSGIAVEPDIVLTTASVVLGAERVRVLTDNGLQDEGQVIGLDAVYNIALVRVAGLHLPTARFAERPAQLGDWVIVLGSSYRAQPTQSVGNVASRFPEPRMSLLQLTNEVYPGNSGGPALNSRGELLGLVQGELGQPQLGDGRRFERRPGGMSFVLPVEDFRPIYQRLRRDGRVPHGWIGVSTRAAFVDSDTEQGVRVPIGALVESVQPDSPAAKLGLVKGDLIVAFEGERVEYPEQLGRWVTATPPGSSVELVWVRNEIQKRGRAVLGESPDAVPSWMLPAAVTAQRAAPATGSAGAAPERVQAIEQEIRRLSRELERLRSPGDSLQ